MESLAMSLATVVGILKLILECISVLCIALGLVTTLSLAVTTLRSGDYVSFVTIRLRFGTWLALALEFQLAADILLTTTAPSAQALGKLGAIAVIRTFLNYFLQRELEAEQRATRAQQPADAKPAPVKEVD